MNTLFFDVYNEVNEENNKCKNNTISSRINSILGYCLNIDILNDELTVATTDDKPIIWFVSTIPLRFKQASIICDMTEHKKGYYYYYNTDELVTGDNKYFVFKKNNYGTKI